MDVARICNVVLVTQKENSLRLKRVTNEIVYFPFAVSEDSLRETCFLGCKINLSGKAGRAHYLWAALTREFGGNSLQRSTKLEFHSTSWEMDGQPTHNNEHYPRNHIGRLLKLYSAGHHFERLRGTGGLSASVGGLINRLLPIPQKQFKNARLHGFLDDAALKVLCRKVAVNVSTSIQGSGYLVGRPKRQFKLRDIEFPCYEVPLLNDPTPELKEIFETGKHVLFYDSWRELVALTRDACRFPDQYRDLSNAARNPNKARSYMD